jgi:hypothetical protein
MSAVRLFYRAVSVGAAVAALAGCAGGQVPGSASGTLPSADSWMSPAARSGDLLYVSDTNGHVYVYSYPAGERVGTLTGFKGPEGLCSDSAGDVYVVDTPAVAVFKYAHGGTAPLEELHTFGYYPEGCSVDPTSGDLAVADYASNPKLGPGAVTIFKGGKGMGKSYQDPSFNQYLFCSYDANGNLYVDGTNAATTQAELAEMPQGSTSFTDITLDRNVGPYPLGVQWDGKYVALQGSTRALYRIDVTGSTGKVVKTMRFKGDRSDLVAQFWITGRTILIPYGNARRSVRKVGVWRYPAGGAATKSIHAPRDAAELFGITVSVAP